MSTVQNKSVAFTKFPPNLIKVHDGLVMETFTI